MSSKAMSLKGRINNYAKSRGIFNTRPRDFYDIYILVKTQKYSKDNNQEFFHKILRQLANDRIPPPSRLSRDFLFLENYLLVLH